MERFRTVCLIGPQQKSFFMDADPFSELLERCAIDLWKMGFGVLAPHLNAPRAEGLLVSESLMLAFEAKVIQKFADALFLLPGWEQDQHMWVRVNIACGAQKPIFDSLAQLVRWRDGLPHASLEVKLLPTRPDIANAKVAFVVGKYFDGENIGGRLVPNRNAIHENILAANRIAVMLWQERIAAFTPHNNTHHFELKTDIAEETYEEFDRMVLSSLIDALVVLHSWVYSSGSKKEVALAQSLGIPVINAYDLPSLRNWRDEKEPVHTVINKTR